MTLSVIFTFAHKNEKPTIVQASDFGTDESSVDVKFNNSTAVKPEVLGVSDSKNEAPKPNNPYQKYQHVADLYEQNPKYVVSLENKISEYIEKYRSNEGTNHRFDVPVPSIIFLETSLKYQVPLSYTLTIARLESRFGTDCYTKLSATRICKHKNIYSMGLDDSGNNLTFQDWEDGVYAFGKWYQDRVNEGYSTCQMWKRYNPNGDYCSKVMAMAFDIEKYFNES
jgi:hypothetical protein